MFGWSVHAAALRHRLDRARRDPLTGLPTRDQFTTRAARLLRKRPVLVVLVDLDRFKPLNDTHGHAAGDAALQAVAQRLRAWARGGIAARLGGDELAAILPAPADPRRELSALHAALIQPIHHQALALDLGASLGAHLTPAGMSPSRALHYADNAMYAAKRAGGGWRLVLTHPGTTATRGRWKRHRPAPAR